MNSVWKVVQSCVATLDHFTESMSKAISWLNLFLVIIVCLVVILRYLLSIGSIAMQELAMYLHAMIFLGASRDPGGTPFIWLNN